MPHRITPKTPTILVSPSTACFYRHGIRNRKQMQVLLIIWQEWGSSLLLRISTIWSILLPLIYNSKNVSVTSLAVKKSCITLQERIVSFWTALAPPPLLGLDTQVPSSSSRKVSHTLLFRYVTINVIRRDIELINYQWAERCQKESLYAPYANRLEGACGWGLARLPTGVLGCTLLLAAKVLRTDPQALCLIQLLFCTSILNGTIEHSVQ